MGNFKIEMPFHKIRELSEIRVTFKELRQT